MLLGWGGGRSQCYWGGEEGGHNVTGVGRREVTMLLGWGGGRSQCYWYGEEGGKGA